MNTLKNQKKRSHTVLSVLSEYACLAVLLITILSASVLAPKFFSLVNLMNILKQGAVVSIVAIGMGYVLISGCMDLSVGVNMAICSIVSVVLQPYMGAAGAIVCALMTGILISMCNFTVILAAKARAIEIMMITFGLKMLYRGLAQALTRNVVFRGQTSDFFRMLGKGKFLGEFPNIALIMIVLAVILGILLSYSLFGRRVVCVGNNPEASRLSGISISKTRLGCFLISGICCGIAGILLASRTGAVKALSGDGYEMDAMCGLVIGGYAVFGGFGSVWRAIIGVFVYSAISNVLNLLGVDAYGQQLAQGIILLLAVWTDVYLRNMRAGGKL